jgi:DnaJ-class molecular chaperone
MAQKHPDIELADRLDAEDRLRNRGYEKQTCERCNGFGQFGSIQCPRCEGKGYWWMPPVTKQVEEQPE